MLAVYSYLAIAVAASTAISSSSAHRMHNSHAMRGLQMDMSGMDMSSSTSMEMTPPTGESSTAMSMTMDMTSSSTTTTSSVSSEDFTCPVCGMSTKEMGYDNLNHIGFANGQIVYTCGMEPRPFDDYSFVLTDSAYLAANVAEFIVDSTDATEYAKCAESCDECEAGIKDPVTGDDVTSSNYQYVCLKNGQKIYFASLESKNEYLKNVNSEPRYLVDSIICEEEKCSDAEQITALSTAAKAFVPASNSTGTTAASGSSAAVSVNSPTTLTFAVASVLAALAVVA